MESLMFLKVWDLSGDVIYIDSDDEPRIDAAVSAYVDSGKTKDSLLMLTTVHGATFKILASEVRSWLIDSPETRKKVFEIDIAMDKEVSSIKTELGLWED